MLRKLQIRRDFTPNKIIHFGSMMFSSTIFLMVMVPNISSDDVIRIGGLFDLENDGQEAAFRYAVNSVNSDRNVLAHVKLEAVIENIPYGDSFRGSRKICSLAKSGVAAILGPQSHQVSAHVQSMCNALEIPHIENMWDFHLYGHSKSISLYPHPSALSKAYLEVLKRLGWRRICVLYEDTDGLIRVQEILKDLSLSVTLRQLPTTKNYRLTLGEVKKSGLTHLFVDVRRESIHGFLQQAQETALLTPYYNYFFTSLDLHTIGIEDFKDSGANITYLSLLDTANPLVKRAIRDWHFGELQYEVTLTSTSRDLKRNNITFLKTDMALMYDAVQLFAKALDDLHRSRRIDVSYLECEEDEAWVHGHSLLNYMKWVQVKGLTGLIKFDPDGFRRDFVLDIIELTAEGLTKAGRWDPKSGGSYTKSSSDVRQRIITNLRNKTLIVSAVLSSPYVMLTEEPSKDGRGLKLEGFCVDLVAEISQMVGFNYSLKLADPGIYDKDASSWSGMIAELMEQRADLAIGDLTITWERKQVVDYTVPWMNLGIGILYKKSSKKTSSFFSFLSPISRDVWLCLVAAYFAASLMIYAISRFSMCYWSDSHPCDGSNDRECDLTFANSIWFCFGSLMQQGECAFPRTVSARLAASVWCFFTLVMVSSYTANLAAFRTLEHIEASKVESVDDLTKQTYIKYGALKGGATWNFFRTSKIGIYQRMYNYMESENPPVYSTSNEEGVRRVQEGDGEYAYLMESPTIEYVTERHCDLFQVGGTVDSSRYGFAVPLGSPYLALINSALLKLRETGRIAQLKQKWWKVRRGGGRCQGNNGIASSKTIAMDISALGGLFTVLLGGMGLASLTAAVEFFWKSRQLAYEKQNSLWVEMRKALTVSPQRPSRSSGQAKKSTGEVLTMVDLANTTYKTKHKTVTSFKGKEFLS